MAVPKLDRYWTGLLTSLLAARLEHVGQELAKAATDKKSNDKLLTRDHHDQTGYVVNAYDPMTQRDLADPMTQLGFNDSA